jgi:hypothetical protein
VHYPPLFPFVLSFTLTHLQLYLRILNGICLLGTIAIMYQVSRNVFSNSIVAFQYLLVLIVGIPLYVISKFVWSEPLFVVLLSVQLYVLSIHFKKPAIRYVLVLVVLSILYTLQRKTGLFFIIGTSIALIMNTHDNKKSKHALLYLSLSMLYIPMWLALLQFKVSFGGTLHHTPEVTMVSGFFMEGLANWIIPPPLPLGVKVVTACTTLLSVIYFLVTKGANLLIAYFTIFIIYFVVMQFFPYYDFTDTDRYLSVVYPIFFLLVFGVIDLAYDFPMIVPVRKFITLCIFLWLLYPAVRTIKNVIFWNNTFGIESKK